MGYPCAVSCGRSGRAWAAALLLGCGGEGEGIDSACIGSARPSVQVRLLGEGGQPLRGAAVAYAVDGGAPAACDEAWAGSYLCGFEIVGRFVITASMEGYTAGEAEAEVVADGCHVRSEEVSMTLAPSPAR